MTGKAGRRGKSRKSGGGFPPGKCPTGLLWEQAEGWPPQVPKHTSRPHGEKHRGCTSLRRAFLGSGGSVPERGCQTRATTGGDAQAGSVQHTEADTAAGLDGAQEQTPV